MKLHPTQSKSTINPFWDGCHREPIDGLAVKGITEFRKTGVCVPKGAGNSISQEKKARIEYAMKKLIELLPSCNRYIRNDNEKDFNTSEIIDNRKIIMRRISGFLSENVEYTLSSINRNLMPIFRMDSKLLPLDFVDFMNYIADRPCR